MSSGSLGGCSRVVTHPLPPPSGAIWVGGFGSNFTAFSRGRGGRGGKGAGEGGGPGGGEGVGGQEGGGGGGGGEARLGSRNGGIALAIKLAGRGNSIFKSDYSLRASSGVLHKSFNLSIEISDLPNCSASRRPKGPGCVFGIHRECSVLSSPS